MHGVRHLILIALLLGCFASAGAQTYPSRPIRIIIGFAPGGGTDIATRAVSQPLSEALGQSIVIDNRPGAGGTIGNALGAKAPADGYTLLMSANGPHVIAPSLYKNLSYDVFKDFAPITMVASSPYVLLVHPSIAASSVGELVSWLKGRSAPATYSSAGTGTPAHLAGELFNMMAKVKVNHVPYKGAAPGLVALIGGEVNMMFCDMPVAAPHLKSGKVRALAVTAETRSALVPDLPTLNEIGLRGFEASSWYGLLAPAGTPGVIVGRLNANLVRILNLPEIQQRFATLGSAAAPGSPADFAAKIKRDYDRWAEVIKVASVRLD